MPEHRCEECGEVLQSHLALHGHRQVQHGNQSRVVGERRISFVAPVTFRCAFCDHTFERHDVLINHIERRHKAERERRLQELAERDAHLPVRKRRGGRRKAQPSAA